jgi:hypothetical protein
MSTAMDREACGFQERPRSVYRTALHAERRTIQNLRAEDTIDDAVARQLLSELDLLEAALMHRPLHASG